MRKIICLLVLLAIPFIIYSCSSDIFLEPEAPLKGEYAGEYIVTEGYGSASQIVSKEFVLWTFMEENYIMRIDTSRATGSCNFCRVDGLYSLSDRVRLVEQHSLPDGADGCSACNGMFNPEGYFRRENTEDTLVLKLRDGTTFKELRLGRVQAE